MIAQRNIVKRRETRLKLLCGKLVKLLKLYLTPNTKLTGRQRLTKLRIETFLSYLLLVVLIIFTLQCVYLYYKVHGSIHIENIKYVHTGYTNVSCYSNYRGTTICCANRPYLTTNFINDSRKPFRTYECYKFKDID